MSYVTSKGGVMDVDELQVCRCDDTVTNGHICNMPCSELLDRRHDVSVFGKVLMALQPVD